MKLLSAFLLALTALPLQAQTSDPPQKIGHADWEYIFSQLPQYKQIENDLRALETQLQNQLKIKAQELEAKFKTYQSLPADTPDHIKKIKKQSSPICRTIFKSFNRMPKRLCRKSRMIWSLLCLQKSEKQLKQWPVKMDSHISSIPKWWAAVMFYCLQMKNIISPTLS